MASLDRFVKKRAIKNILFMPKRSRLEVKKNFGPAFKWFDSRTQKVSEKLAIWKPDIRLSNAYCISVLF
jgi:hypothetical protein